VFCIDTALNLPTSIIQGLKILIICEFYFEKTTGILTCICQKFHYFYSNPRGLYKLTNLFLKCILKSAKLENETPKYLRRSFKVKVTTIDYLQRNLHTNS